MKSIYEMETIELIRTKQITLKKLTETKLEYKKQEGTILLTTDFKELGLTNEKMRAAYINEELFELKTRIKILENSVTILNDLLQLRFIEQGGEI